MKNDTKELRIETNIERNTELRVYLIGGGVTQEVTTPLDQGNRVYNKANLLALRLGRKQLRGVRQVLVVVERRSAKVALRNIMNLSPTFDKTTPTKWIHAKD